MVTNDPSTTAAHLPVGNGWLKVKSISVRIVAVTADTTFRRGDTPATFWTIDKDGVAAEAIVTRDYGEGQWMKDLILSSNADANVVTVEYA